MNARRTRNSEIRLVETESEADPWWTPNRVRGECGYETNPRKPRGSGVHREGPDCTKITQQIWGVWTTNTEYEISIQQHINRER